MPVTSATPSTGRRGRPRDPAVAEAVQAAALELLSESGYAAVSIEAIAARSGVGKQAIYRRWRSKGEVILDAFAARADRTVPLPDTGSLVGDLTVVLTGLFRALQGDAATFNRALMAEALRDPIFGAQLRDGFIALRRDALRPLLSRARKRGEVVAGDEVVLDLVYGPMWYRLLVGHGPLDDGYAQELAAAVAAAANAAPSGA